MIEKFVQFHLVIPNQDLTKVAIKKILSKKFGKAYSAMKKIPYDVILKDKKVT